MADQFDIWEYPSEDEVYLLAGWRQWVDGGAISSGLPYYLIEQTNAVKIGEINSDNCYLFQLPVTQGFFRPIIKHKNGFPETLHNKQNEFFYAKVNGKAIIYFIGDEPHLNPEIYVQNFLAAIKALKVKRTILFGGIYAEVPYDLDRHIHSIYSMRHLKNVLDNYAVTFSDYQGGASIGSYICKRAGEQELEMIGMYAFCPMLQLPNFNRAADTLHIDNDYKAWLDVMSRVDHMLDLNLDLTDLEDKTQEMMEDLEKRIDEVDRNNPDIGLKEYIDRLSQSFTGQTFSPLDDIWQDALRNIDDNLPPHEE